MPVYQYIRANPIVITIPLDTAPNITDYLAQCPQGSVITSITVVRVPSGLTPYMAYGQQPPKIFYQGQCFTFGGAGDCIGAMDLGLCIGTAGVTVAGDFIQLEICFFGGFAQTTASQ